LPSRDLDLNHELRVVERHDRAGRGWRYRRICKFRREHARLPSRGSRRLWLVSEFAALAMLLWRRCPSSFIPLTSGRTFLPDWNSYEWLHGDGLGPRSITRSSFWIVPATATLAISRGLAWANCRSCCLQVNYSRLTITKRVSSALSPQQRAANIRTNGYPASMRRFTSQNCKD